jgi:membrane dipeptidase
MAVPSGLGDRVFIDACFVTNWESSRKVLEDMRAGGVTAANCNRLTWENFPETMTLLSRYKSWISENSDVAHQIYTADDITSAKTNGRVGIIIGFQNTSPIEDRLYYLPLFHELGVRIIQLTYSTACSVGGGCWESRDLPLTDFGHDLVAELNRLGILIDLSHCGAQTASDAIAASSQPVAYTHTCPLAMRTNSRNKSDEQMREIADRGGMIGIAGVLGFLKAGREATIDDYLETVEYAVNVAGEEHVGIGFDLQHNVAEIPDYAERMEYASRDKGYGRWYEDLDIPAYIELMRQKSTPDGLSNLATRGSDLVGAMERRGWSDKRIRNVLGGNWLTLMKEVWRD